MGLLDFFTGGKKPTPSPEFDSKTRDLIEDFAKFKKDTEALQAQNAAWSKEFHDLGSLRDKARQYEKEQRFIEAIALYLNSIERGEQSKLLNIYNYAHDIERVIILYGKTKQKGLLMQFLEEKIKMYPDFRDTKDWAVRLTKLTSTGQVKTTPTIPIDIFPQKASNPTLGKKISDFKKSMPQFNFYFDMAEGSDTFTYNHNVPLGLFNKLRQYREAFETIKSLAKIAENEGDYKKAIEAYEKLIVEECEDAEPYERLIIIYSKLKWKEEEKSTVKRAISFFTQLKEKQLDYTLNLAQKYGMKTKALEYINQDKKIYYYGGAYELYNPQTNRLKKWDERLKKLSQK
jgi:tetratricopeptide (TPR) repeat protein